MIHFPPTTSKDAQLANNAVLLAEALIETRTLRDAKIAKEREELGKSRHAEQLMEEIQRSQDSMLRDLTGQIQELEGAV